MSREAGKNKEETWTEQGRAGSSRREQGRTREGSNKNGEGPGKSSDETWKNMDGILEKWAETVEEPVRAGRSREGIQ